MNLTAKIRPRSYVLALLLVLAVPALAPGFSHDPFADTDTAVVWR